MDANRLFLVYIFVTEGRARGPAILGIGGFLTFVFLGRATFAFLGAPLEGWDLSVPGLIWSSCICDFVLCWECIGLIAVLLWVGGTMISSV